MSESSALKPGDLIVSKHPIEIGRKFSECAVVLSRACEAKLAHNSVKVRWFTGRRSGDSQELPVSYIFEKFDVLEMDVDDSRRA